MTCKTQSESQLRCSTLLFPTLLSWTLLYSTSTATLLLLSSASTLLLLSSASTLLLLDLCLYFYSALLYFFSALLYSTLLYSALLCSTLLYSTLLYSTLLYSTFLYLYSISTIPLQYFTQGPTGHNDLCANEHVTTWSLNARANWTQ